LEKVKLAIEMLKGGKTTEEDSIISELPKKGDINAQTDSHKEIH